jgi:1-acyl-sn-glycerol-3-phosphate acyltransferase
MERSEATRARTHEPHAEGALRLAALGRSVLRGLRVLLLATSFAVFYPVAACFSWIGCSILRVVQVDPSRRRRSCQSIIQGGLRWLHWWLSIVRLFRVHHCGVALPDGACVLIANHPTFLDATAIIARHDNVCCLVKDSLATSFWFGPLLKDAGYVSASNAGGFAQLAMLRKAARRLEEGQRVLIFPEGTRSPDGGVGRFHRGACWLSDKAQVPLVPFVLRCDPQALGRGTPFLTHPLCCPVLTVEVAPRWVSATPGAGLPNEVEDWYRGKLTNEMATANHG